MRFDCIEKPLRKLFHYYGCVVAKFPLIFLTIAIIITSLLAGGLPYLQYNKDTLNLLAPENGRWKVEKEITKSIFHSLNDKSMLPNRLLESGRYAGVIVTYKDDGGSLIDEDALSEILRLHNIVSNISVIDDEGKLVTFQDLCMLWQERCIENSILTFYNYNASLVTKQQLTYPFVTFTQSNPGSNHSSNFQVFIGADMGGVRPDWHGGTPNNVDQVASIRLFYFLRGDEEADDRKSKLWEDAYARIVSQFHSDIIEISWSTSQSLLEEVDKTVNEVLGLWWVGIVLIIFCIGAASTNNWVQSQPMLCLMGMVAASMAILSAFGLMGFLGVPYNILSGSVPFLILGISLDDTFIIIGSWRQTSSQKSVEERMKECLSESALSITITSLTDAVAFSIGIYADFQAVQAFSKTSVSALVLCYIFQLLFFAPCLVFSGKRQEQNRHCFTFRKVKPKKKAKSLPYRIFCAGESSGEGVTGTPAMKFFKDYYAPFLNNCVVTVIVVLGYAGYLGTAMWGYTLLEEGFQERNWVLDDSHLVNYYDLQEQYFTRFGPQISVIATEEVDYWDVDIQQSLEHTLDKLEASEYIFESPEFTTSWLRDYLQYLDNTGRGGNMSKKAFMDTLQNEFLLHPYYKQYNLDIMFSDNNDSIVASRFYVSTDDLHNKREESNMMKECRQVAKDSDVPLIVYHANFVLYDQYLIMWPHTLHNLLIAGGAMFIIALFLIPHPICALIVTASIASIIIGVLGYMSIWSIPLNHIAMVNLILCVGFSVDFSAHICYAFISAPADNKNDRVRYALYCLGLPILQGGLSTILACVGTSTTDAYSYRIFFKTMFLVITLGMLHGLVFLPVFLKIFIPIRTKPSELKEKKKEDPSSAEKYTAPVSHENKSYIVTKTVEGSVYQNGAQVIKGEITWSGDAETQAGTKQWTFWQPGVPDKIPMEGATPVTDSGVLMAQVPDPRIQPVYNPVQRLEAEKELEDKEKQSTVDESLSPNWSLLQSNGAANQTVTTPLIFGADPSGAGELHHMCVSVKYVYGGEPALVEDQQNGGQQQQCADQQNKEQQECANKQSVHQQSADQQIAEQLQQCIHQLNIGQQQLQGDNQQPTDFQQQCANQQNAEQLQQCINQLNIGQQQLQGYNQQPTDFQQQCANQQNAEQDSKTDPDRETIL